MYDEFRVFPTMICMVLGGFESEAHTQEEISC